MPITMPASPGFVSCRFGLEYNTQTFDSPLTNNTETLELDGARWTASYSLPPMNRAQMAEWQAFLAQLRGKANTFYAYDPDATTGRGALSGTPLVKGANQTGGILAIDGCTAGVTNWARKGDYFTVDNKLKICTVDVDSNGSGEVTLYFEPPIADAPADNAPLTVSNATCIMRLVDDGQAMWGGSKHSGFYEGLSFSAVEVF